MVALHGMYLFLRGLGQPKRWPKMYDYLCSSCIDTRCKLGGYGVETLDKSDRIWLTKVDGSKTISIKTPHKACAELPLTEVNGKIYLAYTGLPSEGSNWRQLHIMDVTSQLAISRFSSVKLFCWTNPHIFG